MTRGWVGILGLLVGATPILAESSSHYTGFEWQLPKGFPRPKVPVENPMTVAKVELGRHLFFEPSLSSNDSIACATCHRPELAFSDGRSNPVGVTGELHPRSAMSLTNVAYNRTLEWAQPDLTELEQQVVGPLFATHPVEMGLTESLLEEKLSALLASERYATLFLRAFPGRGPDGFEPSMIFAAIASFERTLISGSSPFDRLLFEGDEDALDEEARIGLKLFLSPRLGCSECHRGFNFSGAVVFEGGHDTEPEFHNTGLYNVGGQGHYPPGGEGLAAVTGAVEDSGKFRVPTLRNIAMTAPYMHDGSIPTLADVIEHYAAGGRAIQAGPFAGVGRDNPYKSPSIKGFQLTDQEKHQLLAFFHSLTDQGFLEDPRFLDPFADSSH